MSHKTQFSYDAGDNLLSLTDANGKSTCFDYNVNNRKKKQICPLGQSTTHSDKAKS
ncbi:MAG TPA: RHS repeat protein [Rhodocyclaceae bacterium]|nr:RHS repeat protein [Rhodocyclaceae bacterium]